MRCRKLVGCWHAIIENSKAVTAVVVAVFQRKVNVESMLSGSVLLLSGSKA